VSAGGHSIEVAGPSGARTKRNVVVAAGRDTIVEFSGGSLVAPPAQASTSNTQKLIGGVSMGVGAVLGAIAVYSLVDYLNLQSRGEALAATLTKPANGKPCREENLECNRIDRDSKTASGLAWVLGGGAALALGFGAYIFFTDSGSTRSASAHDPATPPKPKARVVPTAGAGSGGLVVVGSF
jgi:hypothetical protein